MKLNNLRLRLNILLYGPAILEAMKLDFTLQCAYERANIQKSNDLLNPHTDTPAVIDHLIADGHLQEFDTCYAITYKGKLKLSFGGYVLEAKPAQNAKYAFYLSLSSFLISLISLLVVFLRRGETP